MYRSRTLPSWQIRIVFVVLMLFFLIVILLVYPGLAYQH